MGAAALITELLGGLLGGIAQGQIASEEQAIAEVERWVKKRRDAQAALEAALREHDAAADAAAAKLPGGAGG